VIVAYVLLITQSPIAVAQVAREFIAPDARVGTGRGDREYGKPEPPTSPGVKPPGSTQTQPCPPETTPKNTLDSTTTNSASNVPQNSAINTSDSKNRNNARGTASALRDCPP
jgi:hypothetical protein